MIGGRPLRLLPADPWAEWRRIEERRARRSMLWLILVIVAVPLVVGLAVRALSQNCPLVETAPPRGSCNYGHNGKQDPVCTPGDFDSTLTVAVLCSEGQTRRCKPDKAMRRALLDAYDVPGAGEIDHLIPLCAGGTNNAANLWPQQVGVKQKDKLEAAVCRAICAGTVTPEAGRAVLMNWAWRGPHGEWQTWAR